MASQAMLCLGECVYFGMLSSSTTYRICSSASYTMPLHQARKLICMRAGGASAFPYDIELRCRSTKSGSGNTRLWRVVIKRRDANCRNG